jgi:hypothetical protein
MQRHAVKLHQKEKSRAGVPTDSYLLRWIIFFTANQFSQRITAMPSTLTYSRPLSTPVRHLFMMNNPKKQSAMSLFAQTAHSLPVRHAQLRI